VILALAGQQAGQGGFCRLERSAEGAENSGLPFRKNLIARVDLSGESV